MSAFWDSICFWIEKLKSDSGIIMIRLLRAADIGNPITDVMNASPNCCVSWLIIPLTLCSLNS